MNNHTWPRPAWRAGDTGEEKPVRFEPLPETAPATEPAIAPIPQPEPVPA